MAFADLAGGRVRPAVDGDVDSIRRLTRAAYAKWVPLIGREPLPMSADYELAIRTHRFDLVERDGTLVALIESVVRPDHMWIENLAVSPEYGRRGFGAALLRHLEEVARSMGHVELKLVTNEAFTGNVAFYGRHGFRIHRREVFRGGIGVHLGKRLLDVSLLSPAPPGDSTNAERSGP